MAQVTDLKVVKPQTITNTNEAVTLTDNNRVITLAAKREEGEVKTFSPELPLHYPLLSFLWDAIAIISSLLSINYYYSFSITATGSIPLIPLPIIFAFITVIWLAVFGIRSLYKMQRNSYQWAELVNVVQSVIISGLVLMGILYLVEWQIPRVLLFQQALLAFIFTLGWRSIYHGMSYFSFVGNNKFNRRVLVVGSRERLSSVSTILRQVNSEYIEIVGFVTNAGTVSSGDKLGDWDADLKALVRKHKIDDVITAFTHFDNLVASRVLKSVLGLPVRTYTLPDYMDVDFSAKEVNSLDQTRLVNITLPNLSKIDLFLKRSFDIVVSLVALILTGPVIAMVALAIKLESDGPILFVQERMGYNKEKFAIFKFRSMRVGADKELDTVAQKDENGRITSHKRPDDPRVTRIGKFIRKTSLDELPQIFNVLRGDMSLVGPRPEILRLVNEYEAWQDQRFLVKQGITGWWQVNGRSKNPCHLSTHQDVEYINQFSFLLDIQIILMTIPALLKGKGAF